MDRRDSLKSIAAAFVAPHILWNSDVAKTRQDVVPLVIDTSNTVVEMEPRVTNGQCFVDCSMGGTFAIVCPDGRRSGELQWGGDAELIRKEMWLLFPEGGEFEVAEVVPLQVGTLKRSSGIY